MQRHATWPGYFYERFGNSTDSPPLSSHKRFGLLKPLEVPFAPWTSISMDFITGLKESSGFTQIWVIVDRFSKMSHFIPLPMNAKTRDLARIFLREIWKLHGLPSSIVSQEVWFA